MAREHSLQRRLTFGLIAAIFLTGTVAALLSFQWALHDANEILDGALEDTASLVASGQMAVPEHPSHLPGSEPENETLLVPLDATATASANSIASVLADLPDGMHTVVWQERSWRALVRSVGAGQRIGIAQWTEARDEIAQHSALRTLVPLLLLIPVLVLLVRTVVRRTLAPVAALARHVDSQDLASAAQLPQVGIPSEIDPFVQSIRRLLQGLTEALRQQRRFVADAAHEIRSPMAALQLQAANLEQVVIDGEAQARLQQLRLGIQRLQHLLEQLLSMARSETGSGQREPVLLSRIARDAVAQCYPAAQDKGIDLGMDRSDSALTVLGTAIDLQTLLRNAVDNAVRYAPSGSQVSVSVFQDGDDAVIAVDDEGPGIPQDHLERAFDAFHRVPGSPETGSGLGLAIVAAVAQRHGGHARLVPRADGPGLRFEYRQRAIFIAAAES
jgi:two-component system OmpR family sensor kinase